ncbi:MAG: uracil-DNA glycosylase [Oscillospiraceae bacterium]|nr:uracil-DNA glycosylase [Oscillospiraceae bacterium]
MKYFKDFSELENAVKNCGRCELARRRLNAVFGEGDENAKLMFIGEGPGQVEDETGRPFVGPAGQLLDKMIAAIGLKREEVYIANIVKCRPPHNADPKPEYAEKCMPFLREQVRHIQPKIIVLLGRIAMENILHEKGITRLHGTVYRRGGFIFVPTFHPSALLRDASLKRLAWEDLKKVRALLDEEEE